MRSGFLSSTILGFMVRSREVYVPPSPPRDGCRLTHFLRDECLAAGDAIEPSRGNAGSGDPAYNATYPATVPGALTRWGAGKKE